MPTLVPNKNPDRMLQVIKIISSRLSPALFCLLFLSLSRSYLFIWQIFSDISLSALVFLLHALVFLLHAAGRLFYDLNYSPLTLNLSTNNLTKSMHCLG